jgi:hypothetical protein
VGRPGEITRYARIARVAIEDRLRVARGRPPEAQPRGEDLGIG